MKEKAAAQGVAPDFGEEEYAGNKVPVQWRCLANPEHRFVARFNNLINGCPLCRSGGGSPKRLAFDQVEKRAMSLGFKPGFSAEEYAGNRTLLPWVCLADASHAIVDTLAHLERGCPTCRLEQRKENGAADVLGRIKKELDGRGDRLLSGALEIENTGSGVQFVCGLCGQVAEQQAFNILRGKRHACNRMAAAQLVRKKAAYDEMVKELAQGGIVLETPMEEYEGVRSTVRYRLTGSKQTEQATITRLRALAAKGASA